MKIFISDNINEKIKTMKNNLKEHLKTTKLPKSGFYIDKILFLFFFINKLKLTKCSSYKPLPDWIKNKGAIINPKNKS